MKQPPLSKATGQKNQASIGASPVAKKSSGSEFQTPSPHGKPSTTNKKHANDLSLSGKKKKRRRLSTKAKPENGKETTSNLVESALAEAEQIQSDQHSSKLSNAESSEVSPTLVVPDSQPPEKAAKTGTTSNDAAASSDASSTPQQGSQWDSWSGWYWSHSSSQYEYWQGKDSTAHRAHTVDRLSTSDLTNAASQLEEEAAKEEKGEDAKEEAAKAKLANQKSEREKKAHARYMRFSRSLVSLGLSISLKSDLDSILQLQVLLIRVVLTC